MLRRTARAIALVTIGVLGLAGRAVAVVLLVDDDNVPCISGTAFHRIGDAVAVANAEDEIQICPGVYAEQVVLTKSLTLRGLALGNFRPVIMPAALPASRPSTQGGVGVRAAILVDAPRVVIEDLDVELRFTTLSGCSPAVAGIYLRNAGGSIEGVRVFGAHATAPAGCDTGVGLFVEGGQFGSDFGRPISRKAVVSIRGSEFNGNQKGGIVALGDGTVLKLEASSVTGDGASGVGTPNGIELSNGVRARVQDFTVRNLRSAVPGKLSAGVLVFRGGKVRLRRPTITNVQAGVFVVGDSTRVLDGQFGDITSDGLIFMGRKNRAFSNDLDVSSVSGVFIDGDRNIVRGGTISRMPVGVWFFDGERSLARGIDFIDVPLPERVGELRNLSEESADPFTLRCTASSQCDDGNPCTVDSCTLATGACAATSLPNFTSCADATVCNGTEVCLAGVCQPGTPLVCVDGVECTQDLVCNPTLGCQYPPLPDGATCGGGAGLCIGGVCS
jgi:hypothetical protein